MTEQTQEQQQQAAVARAQQTAALYGVASAIGSGQNTAVSAAVVKGIVTAVALTGAPPTISIQMSGDTTTTIEGVRFIDSYSPVVNDTVLLVKQGSDVFALGQINDSNEGTTANGWTQPTLNTNYSHDSNLNGPLKYRLIVDNGDRKLQFKGSVALTGSPSTTIFTLPTGFRPSTRVTVLAPRNPDGSNVEQLDINTDGTVVRMGSLVGVKAVGTTTGITNTDHKHRSSDHAIQNPPQNVTADHWTDYETTSWVGGANGNGEQHSHTVTVTTVPQPVWIGFHGIEVFL